MDRRTLSRRDRLTRTDTPARELGPVALPLAAFVAWTGLSLSWTDDLSKGSVELLETLKKARKDKGGK